MNKNELNDLFLLVTVSAMFSITALFTFILLLAMSSSGTVIIAFNLVDEGFLEIILFVVLLFLSTIALISLGFKLAFFTRKTRIFWIFSVCLMLFLVIFSVFIISPFVINSVDLDQAVSTTEDDRSNLSVTKDPMVSVSQTSNDWVTSESIKTVTTFASSFVDILSVQFQHTDPDDSYNYNDAYNSHTNSTNGAEIEDLDLDNDEDMDFDFMFRVFTQRTGTLYYRYEVISTDDGIFGGLSQAVKIDSFEITNDHINLEGYTWFMFQVNHIGYPSSSELSVRFVSFVYDAQYDQIDYGYENDASITNTTSIIIDLQHLEFVPDPVTEYIRSEYRPLSFGNEHRWEVENFDYQSTIVCSVNSQWTTLNTYPDVTYSVSGNDYTFTDTVPVTYTFHMLSNSSNYLAIEESNDYFENQGFENGYSADWTNNGFSSVSLNSTIVSEGAFSAQMIGAVSTNCYLEYSYASISDSDIYLSFDSYFTDSLPYTPFALYYQQKDGSWGTVSDFYDSSSLNRWQKHNYYFEVGDYYPANPTFKFYFYSTSGGCTFYLDNFRIWGSSIEAYTNDQGTNTLKPTLIDWDGYSNNPASYTAINVTYGTRADNTTIQSWNKTTDANGQVTITATDSLTSAEHFVRVYAYDNTFTDDSGSQKSYFAPVYPQNSPEYFLDVAGDELDFGAETTESVALTNFGTASASDGYLTCYASSTTGNIRWDSLSIDSSVYDQVDVRIKTNSTSGATMTILDSASNDVADASESITSSYAVYSFNLNSASWTGTETSLRLYFTNIASGDQVWIDFVHLYDVDPISLKEYDSYFYLSSTNDTLKYKIYQDESYAGIYNDLSFIQKNKTVGSHNLTYVVFQDMDVQRVYLPSSSTTYTFTVEGPEWSFTALDFQVLDRQCNFVFATSWDNLTASIYENGTLKGTANENVVFTWQRNLDYDVLRNVTIVIDDVTLTYYYRNEEANSVFCRMYLQDLESDRIALTAESNWDNALFDVDDNTTAGLEVSGQYSGTYTFARVASYGNFQINVTAYYDFNGDGSYSSNEYDTVLYNYSIYEEKLIIETYSHVSIENDIASFAFKTNYRGTNRTQFRVKAYNITYFTDWLYEDDYNGSYAWSTALLTSGLTYLAELEIRCNITTASGTSTTVVKNFYYTVYRATTSVDYDEDNIENYYYQQEQNDALIDEMRGYRREASFFGSLLAIAILTAWIMGILALARPALRKKWSKEISTQLTRIEKRVKAIP